MKILIVNQPLGNRGDESAHKAFVRRLLERIPGCDVEVLLINQEQEDIDIFRIPSVTYTNIRPEKNFYKFYIGSVKRGIPAIAVLHPQVRSIIRKFKQADRIICAPGGINLGGFREWMHLATMYHALRNNPKVAYFSRSIGPFNDDRFSRLSGHILRSVSYLSLRDRKSYDIALSLGCRPHLTLDSAFLEKPDAAMPSELDKGGYAVMVPNKLVWHHDFLSVDPGDVAAFFQRLAERLHDEYPKLKIVMLPQLCGRQNDVDFMEGIAGESDYIRVCGAGTASDTQQAIIRNAAFLVGCRYHAIVFAINNDTPFAALDYEHKIGGMLEMVGLGDRAVKFNSNSLNDNTIDKLISILKTGCVPASGKASQIASIGFDELLGTIF